jgi:hypothetical protein
MIVLFNKHKRNATSPVQTFSFPNQQGFIKIWGTWDGATIALEVQTPTTVESAWVPVLDAYGVLIAHTSDISTAIRDFVFDDQIRAVLTNAGPNTDLSCTIQTSGWNS